MKRYFEFINEAFFANLEDSELREKLEELEREKREIEDEILQINLILKERQEQGVINFVKDFPKSIFDLNKEQLNWIFEFETTKTMKFDNARNYFSQLDGIMVYTGSKSKTDQYQVRIHSEDFMNQLYVDSTSRADGNEFELNSDQIESIKFLGDNLKREDSAPIEFFIEYVYWHSSDLPDKILYQDENNIYYGKKKYNSIEAVLRQIVKMDIENRKEDDGEDYDED
jgi:uncharacterized protein YlzI (FlbEa/FlbD family)